jgi:hypothetical protein
VWNKGNGKLEREKIFEGIYGDNEIMGEVCRVMISN